MIGEWMKERMNRLVPPVPNLVVGRAIQIMAEMTGVTIPDKPSQEFWDNELPRLFEERLTDPDFKASSSFDHLVLDEAQEDILARSPFGSASRSSSSAAGNGAFVLFGDFENQVLADRRAMNQNLAALDASARPSRWRLTENCRNYRIVGDTALRLGGLGNGVYSGYMRWRRMQTTISSL
jgi:hypothetical protein